MDRSRAVEALQVGAAMLFLLGVGLACGGGRRSTRSSEADAGTTVGSPSATAATSPDAAPAPDVKEAAKQALLAKYGAMAAPERKAALAKCLDTADAAPSCTDEERTTIVASAQDDKERATFAKMIAAADERRLKDRKDALTRCLHAQDIDASPPCTDEDQSAILAGASNDNEKAALAQIVAGAEDKRKKDAEKLAEAEEKQRLASRKFVWVSAEGLAQQLALKNDPDELWGTTYQGKYVRWQAKYERPGTLVLFIASTGDETSLSCKDFDPAHDPNKFSNVGQWDAIVVEGRLDVVQKQWGKDKVEFKLKECIAKKM